VASISAQEETYQDISVFIHQIAPFSVLPQDVIVDFIHEENSNVTCKFIVDEFFSFVSQWDVESLSSQPEI
jgi:hypothetical protein